MHNTVEPTPRTIQTRSYKQCRSCWTVTRPIPALCSACNAHTSPLTTNTLVASSALSPCACCHNQQQVKQVTKLDADGACPFVGESLRILRQEVGNEAAVLGFVGAPFTLATYIVEGGSSKNFAHIKQMAFGSPEILHALLDKLADNVADYVRYQVGYRCCWGCGGWTVQYSYATTHQLRVGIQLKHLAAALKALICQIQGELLLVHAQHWDAVC